MKIYHTTDVERLDSISQNGLVLGKELNHTNGGIWVKDVLGCQPLYFAVNCAWYPSKENQVVLRVNKKAFDRRQMLPDLPRLIDNEMQLGEDYKYYFWADDADVPQCFKGKELSFADLLNMLDECIALTQSFAYSTSVANQYVRLDKKETLGACEVAARDIVFRDKLRQLLLEDQEELVPA